jgi:16S rRNA processing protein RimM
MRVVVGRIGRPHGIRGEVVIGVRTDEPDLRFAVGAIVDVSPTLAAPEGLPGPGGPGESGGEGSPPGSGGSRGVAPPGERSLTVASARWHSGQLLVAFAGITDRTAAAELTGSWLSVDSSQLPETGDPDEFRDYELIGLSVRTCAGDPVGVVTDVLHYGQDLLVVRRQDEPGGEALIPFVKAIVPEVDIRAGVVVIDPPPGLLDHAQAE